MKLEERTSGTPCTYDIYILKKKMKPSFSREIVPSEKVFFIDKKDMPIKKNNNKTLCKIPKERKNQ